MEAFTEGSLLSFLAAVPDPRSRHGRRHPLSAILALVCCAIMCGAKSYAAIAQWGHDQDIALMHRLGFTRKPPKSGGIRKVLIALAPNAFEARPDPLGGVLAGPTTATERALPRRSPWTARRLAAASTAWRRPCICCRWWPTSRG